MVALNQASAASSSSRVPSASSAAPDRLHLLSPNPVTDEATLDRRAELFSRRAGFYYEHWDELYEGWLEKVEATTTELAEALGPAAARDRGRVDRYGWPGAGIKLRAPARVRPPPRRGRPDPPVPLRVPGLGYGAYLAFYDLCRQPFPGDYRPDDRQDGLRIHVLVLRPDEELRRLARLARRSRGGRGGRERARRGRARCDPRRQRGRRTVARRLRGDEGSVVSTSPTGRSASTTTIARGSTTRGSRSGSSAPTLRDSTSVKTPLPAKRAGRARAGHRGAPPLSLRTREASTRASRSPARSSPTSRTTTSRSTTATSRSSGTRCARSVRSWRAPGSSGTERTSSCSATTRCAPLSRSSGSTGARGAGCRSAPRMAASRGAAEGDLPGDARVGPPPALGRLHEETTDPITVMLRGITDERLRDGLSPDGAETETLTGCPASPGVVEGWRGCSSA